MMSPKGLRRFWFEFDIDHPRRCGVTAFDLEHAKRVVLQIVFQNGELPPIVEIVEDVDVTTLDPAHVLPNIGDCARVGVWWPPLRS